MRLNKAVLATSVIVVGLAVMSSIGMATGPKPLVDDLVAMSRHNMNLVAVSETTRLTKSDAERIATNFLIGMNQSPSQLKVDFGKFHNPGIETTIYEGRLVYAVHAYGVNIQSPSAGGNDVSGHARQPDHLRDTYRRAHLIIDAMSGEVLIVHLSPDDV
jgi:hypothetical protein